MVVLDFLKLTVLRFQLLHNLPKILVTVMLAVSSRLLFTDLACYLYPNAVMLPVLFCTFWSPQVYLSTESKWTFDLKIALHPVFLSFLIGKNLFAVSVVTPELHLIEILQDKSV